MSRKFKKHSNKEKVPVKIFKNNEEEEFNDLEDYLNQFDSVKELIFDGEEEEEAPKIQPTLAQDNPKQKLAQDISLKQKKRKKDLYGSSLQSPSLPKSETLKTLPSDSTNIISSIHRQIQFLFNKLSIQNFNTIISDIISIITNNINTSALHITKSLIHNICTQNNNNNTNTTTLISILTPISALVASIHYSVGNKHSYILVESIVRNIFAPDIGIAIRYLVILLLMFRFNVIDIVLIDSLLTEFSDNIQSGNNLELLNISLKHIGTKIKADSPLDFKSILINLNRHNTRVTEHLSSFNANNSTNDDNASEYDIFLSNIDNLYRIKFIYQFIVDIKNNKCRTSYDDDNNIIAVRDAVKWLKEYKTKTLAEKSSIINSSPFSVKFKDIISKKGTWFINLSNTHHENTQTSNNDRKLQNIKVSDTNDDEQLKLLETAAIEQRMSTDLSKNIFYIIMGSEDILTAFDKIIRLNLHGHQTRILFSILLNNITQESTYNPYYSHLALMLCNYSHSYTFSFQLAVWDLLQQFESFSSRNKQTNINSDDIILTRRINYAGKMLGFLVRETINKNTINSKNKGSIVSLSIFKQFDFSNLSEVQLLFLYTTLEGLFTEPDVLDSNVTKEIFSKFKAKYKDTLSDTIQGLNLFISNVFAPSIIEKFMRSSNNNDNTINVNLLRRSLDVAIDSTRMEIQSDDNISDSDSDD